MVALRQRLRRLEEAARAKRQRQSVNFWDLLTHAVCVPDSEGTNIVVPMKDGVPIDVWDFVSGAVKADNMVREDIQGWDQLGPCLQEAARPIDDRDLIEEAIYAPLEALDPTDPWPAHWARQKLKPPAGPAPTARAEAGG